MALKERAIRRIKMIFLSVSILILTVVEIILYFVRKHEIKRMMRRYENYTLELVRNMRDLNNIILSERLIRDKEG